MVDTFNKDNEAYKDLCMGLELDGKDIVFEERYDILYPNNVSLCESNCTMKSTDFDLERINCMCTYKEIMDFDRIDEDNNDLLGNPNFYKPTQSSANVEVIKCLAKIGVKEGLVNNEAFYIIGSFIIIELGMTAISFIHGIKSVAGFVKGLLGNSEGKSAFNSKRNNQVMNSTHRLLNNPPKKGEENDKKENDESNIGNIVIKKNIKMDYALNDDDNVDSKNEISEMSLGNDNDNDNISESNKNYNLNIKSGLPKSKNKPNNLEDINNSKGKLINKKNINNNNKDLHRAGLRPSRTAVSRRPRSCAASGSRRPRRCARSARRSASSRVRRIPPSRPRPRTGGSSRGRSPPGSARGPPAPARRSGTRECRNAARGSRR